MLLVRPGRRNDPLPIAVRPTARRVSGRVAIVLCFCRELPFQEVINEIVLYFECRA